MHKGDGGKSAKETWLSFYIQKTSLQLLANGAELRGQQPTIQTREYPAVGLRLASEDDGRLYNGAIIKNPRSLERGFERRRSRND